MVLSAKKSRKHFLRLDRSIRFPGCTFFILICLHPFPWLKPKEAFKLAHIRRFIFTFLRTSHCHQLGKGPPTIIGSPLITVRESCFAELLRYLSAVSAFYSNLRHFILFLFDDQRKASYAFCISIIFFIINNERIRIGILTYHLGCGNDLNADLAVAIGFFCRYKFPECN